MVEGIDIVNALEKVPTDPQTDKPTTPQIIKSIRVMAVTPKKFIYDNIITLGDSSAMAPAIEPPLMVRAVPAIEARN